MDSLAYYNQFYNIAFVSASLDKADFASTCDHEVNHAIDDFSLTIVLSGLEIGNLSDVLIPDSFIKNNPFLMQRLSAEFYHGLPLKTKAEVFATMLQAGMTLDDLEKLFSRNR